MSSMRQTQVPADKDIIIDGVKCGVVKYGTNSYLFAILELTADFEGRLSEWPPLQEGASRLGMYVTSRGGQRREAYNFERASAILGKLHTEEELAWISAERSKLVERLPVAHLNALIQKAHQCLQKSFGWDAATRTAIRKAVQAARAELERLTASDPLEIILEEILAERLGRWSLHSHNRDVLERLEELVLRGAGEYVEIPDLEQLYREKLEAAQVSSVGEICWDDLRLRIEDYAVVAEDDPEIEWAPLEIPYPSGLVAPKGEASPKLKIIYAYKGEGEQRQAAACVVIPLSAFNPKVISKNKTEAREEEKARKRALITAIAEGNLLPVLPHEHLKWWIRIEGEKNKSAEGFQGEALAAQLRHLPAR